MTASTLVDVVPSTPPAAIAPHRGWWRRRLETVERHPLITVFAVAMAARLVAVALIYARYGGFVFLDETTYSQLAAQMATGGTEVWDGYVRGLYWATSTFLLPLTAIYAVFGEVVWMGQALVAVVGSIAAVAGCRLAMFALPARWSILAGLAVALMPSQVLWSSLTLKDAFVWATVALIAVQAARLLGARNRSWILHGVVLIALLVALARLRDHTVFIVVWTLFASMVIAPGDRMVRGVASLGVAVVLPALLGLGIGGIDPLVNRNGFAETRALNAIDANTAVVPQTISGEMAAQEAREIAASADEKNQRIAELEDAVATAESDDGSSQPGVTGPSADDEMQRLRDEVRKLKAEAAQLEKQARLLRSQAERALREQRPLLDDAFGSTGELYDTSLIANVKYLPTGLSVALFRPYPWQLSGSGVRFAALESLLWYPLYALAAVGLVATVRRRLYVLLFPLAAASGAILASTLTQGNIGTAYRHRGEVMVVVAVLAAVGAHAASRGIAGRARRPLAH